MSWLGAVPPSEVRARFALRLKSFRQSAGFKTARSFAEALELDENRYTRYERGEVEPNLANICKMCSVLGVEPNQLLGFSQSPGVPTTSARGAPNVDTRVGSEPALSEALRVASAIVSLRCERGGHSAVAGDDDPLTRSRTTAEICARLLSNDRDHVVAEILNDTALDGLEFGPQGRICRPDRLLYAKQRHIQRRIVVDTHSRGPLQRAVPDGAIQSNCGQQR